MNEKSRSPPLDLQCQQSGRTPYFGESKIKMERPTVSSDETHSNCTNQIHNVYSLHTFIVFLLHVSVSHSPSSGRTFVPFAQNHILLCSCNFSFYSSYIVNLKMYNYAYTGDAIL